MKERDSQTGIPGSAGSIEQHLDMVEDGNLKGELALGRRDERRRDRMTENYNVDMSEDNREGDEMSGDGHSSGMQGGEEEIEHQHNIDAGMPGDETDEQERLTEAGGRKLEGQRHRA